MFSARKRVCPSTRSLRPLHLKVTRILKTPLSSTLCSSKQASKQAFNQYTALSLFQQLHHLVESRRNLYVRNRSPSWSNSLSQSTSLGRPFSEHNSTNVVANGSSKATATKHEQQQHTPGEQSRMPCTRVCRGLTFVVTVRSMDTGGTLGN